MANKGKRMLFEDEYNYLTDLKENHPDPSAEWSGGSGGDVNIEAGTGITITTESDDTKVISLDTTPSTFEVTADTGMTLEVENQNPLYNDAKLQMTNAGSTRLEGATVDIEGTNIYLHSDSAPYYVNNTSHEYKALATTDQLFSGDYNDLTNKPTIPTEYSYGYGLYTTGSTVSVDTSIVATLANNNSYTGTNTFQTLQVGAPKANFSLISTQNSTADDYRRGLITFQDYNVHQAQLKLSTKDTQATQLNSWYAPVEVNTGSSMDISFNRTNGDSYKLPSKTAATYTIATTSDIPTATSQLTNDSGFITSSDLPRNHVTTNTDQTITGVKTFEGEDKLVLQGATATQKPGFAVLDYNDDKRGYLELRPGAGDKTMVLGVYNKNNYTDYSVYRVGLREYNHNNSNYTYSTLMPKGSDKYTTFGTGNMNMVLGVNGQTADDSGNVSLTLPDEVTANTGSTPSATLTDIQVGSTVYSIPQGGSTPTNMVTTDTAQDITASKSFTGNANIYVQSGATYTASDTMITNQMVSASQIDGSLVSAGQLALSDSTTAGQSQIRVRDFSQGVPFTDYTIEVPTKNGTMALTSDITTVAANTGATTTATLTSLQVGSTVYEVPQGGGGGGSYTFTNGLTESGGTVSWDYNDQILTGAYKNIWTLPTGVYELKTGWYPYSGSSSYTDQGLLIIKANQYFCQYTFIGSDNSNYATKIIIGDTRPSTGAAITNPYLFTMTNSTSTQRTLDLNTSSTLSCANIKNAGTSDKVSVADLVALITYAKSQGWIS